MILAVGRYLQLVLSKVPADTPDDEFNSWYDAHLPEILSIPGFAAATRFRLRPAVVNPDAEMPYDYLTVYELDGDLEHIMKEMERLGLVSKESYVDLKEVSDQGPQLPPWWDGVRFASWNCVPIGERVQADA